ncbi:hypothetical protein FBUS_10684 [Fasciolopsis buskii]|uniref:Pre-rRNA-processing protein TSR2 homolog n=1 Tax=Fasciolopsis buskii TaxID=27845 RepID=A0A8E0RUG5_9TREM|nr:hypothetical protein FBUS_10684 [Fasciolopsis buski]
MQGPLPLYTEYASKVLHSWTSLRICMNEGSGGPNTLQKVNTLIEQMHTVACRLKDEEKLADFLEDYLDLELNMICEDDSIPEVAKLLMDGAHLVRDNRLSELRMKMDSLPSPCDLNKCQSQSNVIEFEGDAEDSQSSESGTEEGHDVEMNE